jgi:transketolase C-terminal domain/subunit
MSTQLIKNKIKPIPDDEEKVYMSKTLDYIITLDKNDVIKCYGSQVTDLTNFIFPGVNLMVSTETGEYFLKEESFADIIDVFEINPEKQYYILILKYKENDTNNSTLFLFDELEDCMGFNVFLTEVSLYAKTAYLKNLKVKNENC